MKEPIAQFRFSHYQVRESLIKINDPKGSTFDGSLEINQSGSVSDEQNIYILNLEVKLIGDENSFEISVKTQGYFEFDKKLSNEQKDDFFKVNAPAILFPHIRAYITSLTALSGIAPIVLPTINFSKRA